MTYLQFAVAGEQAGAKGLHAAALLAQAKLDREPVAGGQLLDVLVRGAQTGQADLLTEARKGRIGKERRMAHQLVADVRLGRVLGLGVVANVLGGVEDAKGQAGEKVPRAEQAGGGAQAEASAVWFLKKGLKLEIKRKLSTTYL